MKYLIIALLFTLALACLNSCTAPDPMQDPDPAIVNEYTQFVAEVESAATVLEAAQAEYQSNPTVATRQARDEAQANYDAVEEAFALWERDYFKEKNGPIFATVANIIGAWHPAAQGVAGVGSAWLLNLAAGLARPRSRKLIFKAAKKAVIGFAPKALSKDGTPFQPIKGLTDALGDLVKASGWGHTSEASEAAAVSAEEVVA